MPVTYTVTVLKSRIESEFLPGGQGYRWMDRVRLAMHTAAVAAAPSRTNTLRAAHRSYARGYGGSRVDVRIVNDAEHAEWVHGGTANNGEGRIEPKHKDYLWVPIAPNSTYRVYRGSVKGQKANPWLDRACTAIAMSQGAVVYG